MRTLWKILLGGLVVFMALAITQQWGYFSSVWFGSEPEPEAASDEDTEAAVDAVRNVLILIEHFYGTGGDPRFAERIPLSPQALSELQADVEYLRKNRRRQEPRLQRLEVLDTRALSADRVEVKTKEYWIHRIFWLDGSGEEAEPPHSQVITTTYMVVRRDGTWWVERWELDNEAPAAAGEPGP